ncbi:right-handed parallel beta-helix repeat-containing protein [Verrucomicrobiota bacterium]
MGRRGYLPWAVVFLVVCCCSVAVAADYYVSPTGKDTDPGTLAKPWKSLSISVGKINAGDTLHLQVGATFTENVYIGPGDGGTVASPKVIVGESANRPVLQPAANGDNALYIYNTAGLEFRNVRFVGPGKSVHLNDGVSGYVDTVRQCGLTFRNCEFTGFGGQGLVIGGWNGTDRGFGDVLVEDCVFHDNLKGGMSTYAQYPSGNTNVVVRRCWITDHPHQDGSVGGLVLGGVTDGLIEHCIATNNGYSVAIWAYDSTRVTIQFCEAYDNHALNQDGGGFDLDGGCQDCVIQYCYSHDNDGAGFLICQYSGARAFTGNTVRYCISENDGRRQTGNVFGGIHFYSSGSSGGLQGTRIYGNTVLNSVSYAVRFQSTGGQTGGKMWNNIFITTGGKALVQGSVTTNVVQFQGNCYWSSGGAFKVAGYSSLAAWRTAKSQEMLSGSPVGFQLDPKLVAPGTGGTIGNTTNLPLLAAYKLRGTSALIDRGLNLATLFGINAGARDFYGNAIPQCRTYDVGAYESPDADGDFVPDDWETIYFGGLDVSDGVSHQDVDGVCDRDEFVAGTDPTNATSCFAVTDMTSRDGTNVVLTWPSTVGRCYAIRTDTNLVQPGDTLLVSGIAATPPSNVYTCTVDNASARFYRAVIQEAW